MSPATTVRTDTSTSVDSTRRHLDEVAFRNLEDEEEFELGARIQELTEKIEELEAQDAMGSTEEIEQLQEERHRHRAKLVRHNLQFAVAVAKDITQGDDRERFKDATQIAEMVLWDLSTNYDPRPEDNRVRFTSYASSTVTKETNKILHQLDEPIYVPAGRRMNEKKIKEFVGEYREKHNRPPSKTTIARALDLPESQAEQVWRDYVALDAPPPGKRDSGEVADTRHALLSLEDNGTEKSRREECRDVVPQVLVSLLTDEERRVLELKLGFGGHRPLPLKEIAARSPRELGRKISPERVRQIKKQALEKLKDAVSNDQNLRSMLADLCPGATPDIHTSRDDAAPSRETPDSAVPPNGSGHHGGQNGHQLSFPLPETRGARPHDRAGNV